MNDKKVTRYKSEFKKLHQKVCEELQESYEKLKYNQSFPTINSQAKIDVLQDVKDWFDEAQEAAEPAEPIKKKK